MSNKKIKHNQVAATTLPKQMIHPSKQQLHRKHPNNNDVTFQNFVQKQGYEGQDPKIAYLIHNCAETEDGHKVLVCFTARVSTVLYTAQKVKLDI